MDRTLIKTIGARLVRNEDGTHTVHVIADKVPNKHGYGFTRESGTATRAYGRMVARKHLTPEQGKRIDVSKVTGDYIVGTDLWRTYTVTGVVG